ncbi:O-antigen ligase family protein [Actinomycetes bacterium M1A6_2h]
MTKSGAPAAVAGIAAAVASVLVGAALGSGQATGTLVGIALLGMVVGVTVTIASPLVVFIMLAFVLGGLPYAVIPGAGPAILVLAVGIWAATLTHPIENMRTHSVEVAVALLLLVSVASVIISADSTRHVSEFIKWAIATSMIFPLMRLSRRNLRTVGLAYAWGATFGGGFSFLLFLFDKSGATMDYLSPIGYGVNGTIGTTLRFFEVDDQSIVRLTGTYVDPNAAGLFLFLGLALALALMRGWIRVVAVLVIGFALVASLSRSAIFSVVVAALIYLAFQRLTATARFSIIGAGLLIVVGALAVPTVNARFFNSFSSGDTGTDDRAEALGNFLPSMNGHWWFGRGWGAKELIDQTEGYKVNYVANTPLLTIYRGGILVGIVFIALLLVGIVAAHATMRQVPWESGVIGAAFIGFTLVALQLDFPVVTNGAATMMFSVMLVMLVKNPITADDPACADVDTVYDRTPEVTNG